MALDKKAQEALENLSKIVEKQREIVEKQNLTDEQQLKMLEDFEKFTKAHDDAVTAYKEELDTATKLAKEAEERAITVEKQFAMLKDNGVKDGMSPKTDKELMAAMLRGPEYLDEYCRSETGAKALDEYINHVASLNVSGMDFSTVTAYHKAAQNAVARKSANVPSMRTDVNLQGGVLLTPEQANEIMRKAIEKTPIERYARNVTISGKSIQQPVHEQLPKAHFAGELQSATNVTPKYSMMEFSPARQSVVIPVSMEMLNQSDYDIVSEVNLNAAEAFAVGLGYASISGTGVSMPEGIVENASVPTTDTAANDAIVADDILKMVYEMKSAYNPTYFMNRRVLGRIRLMKDSATGRYIWSPGGDLNEGNMPTINGLPYVDTFNDMPTQATISTGDAVVLLAEMDKFYQITKNANIFVLRDDVTKSAEAQVNFVFHRWITGNVRSPEAGLLLKVKT